jgi:hypothetical protein
VQESVSEKRSKSSTEGSEVAFVAWPTLTLTSHDDEHTLPALADFVNARITARNAIDKDLHSRGEFLAISLGSLAIQSTFFYSSSSSSAQHFGLTIF